MLEDIVELRLERGACLHAESAKESARSSTLSVFNVKEVYRVSLKMAKCQCTWIPRLKFSSTNHCRVRLEVSLRRPIEMREPRQEAFRKAFGGGSAKLILGCPEQVLSRDNQSASRVGRRLPMLRAVGR